MVCIRASIAHIGRLIELEAMVGFILFAVCVTLAAEATAIDEASMSAFITQACFVTCKPVNTVVVCMTVTASL